MQQEVEDADIVIVATNAEKAVITKQSLLHSGPKVLIDLSIPNNIEAVCKFTGTYYTRQCGRPFADQ
jgi:glutamyl-tRNA reductase